MTCVVYKRDSQGVLREYTAVAAQVISPGQRLFELIALDVPMHPQKWDELHHSWQVLWEQKAQKFLEGSTL